MPLYEYECWLCGWKFEHLTFGGEQPVCPICNGEENYKVMSAPSFKFADGFTATGHSGFEVTDKQGNSAKMYNMYRSRG
jgi:putative FmdB family regulatory protein